MNAMKSAAAFLSSCILELLFQMISLLALVPGFSTGSLARQIHGRTKGRDSIDSIQPSGPSCRGDLVFFCSSAGEFEQARPIIDRLSGRFDLDPIIFCSFHGRDLSTSVLAEKTFEQPLRHQTPCGDGADLTRATAFAGRS